MLPVPLFRRSLRTAMLLVLARTQATPSDEVQKPTQILSPRKLSYNVEWRLVTAGTARFEVARAGTSAWETKLDLESSGFVNRLYRVIDSYKVYSNDQFCPSHATLDAQEGKKHMLTSLIFDTRKRSVRLDESNLVKNTSTSMEIEVAPCTHEILGALASLGQMDLPIGKSATLPITDGKRMVYAKVQAQAKETINVEGRNYAAIRYEAFLFDNVLYKRKGRLFVWLTDDIERTPVQFRIQLGFPIGTISVELQDQQKS